MTPENPTVSAPPRPTARGFQKLLLGVAVPPFVASLGSVLWLAYLIENPEHPVWVVDFCRLWLVAVPLSWGLSLGWGWRRARRISRALEELVSGQAQSLPDEFSGITEHLLVMQASLRQKEHAEASYRGAMQRVEVQHRLLQRLSSEGLGEVDLEGWAESLRQALDPGLHPKELALWVQDGSEFVWSAGQNPPVQRRRGFVGSAPCWIETNAAGEHHFFLKVSASYEASPEMPRPILLVVQLWLEPGAERLDEARERLQSLLPMLSLSWSNWTLFHELFTRIRINRDVVESLEDGVILADHQATILSATRSAGRILGLTPEQLQGRQLSELIPLPEGQWSEDIARRRLLPSFEVELPRPNLASVAVCVINCLARGKLTTRGLAVTVVLRDITKQRELENLRSDFTATLSHELRTPLTSMKGYLQTLMHRKARQFDIDKIQSIVSVINGQADQLQRLIQELLEAAKMRSQDLEIRPRPVELMSLLKECLAEYSNPKVQQTVVGPGECLVLCDPERIGSVLEQLLSNAQKYSLPGGVVELGCQPQEGSARIWVRDEGVGIPQDQQEKIFEMYHRLDTGNQRTHYGIGVGLYIARKVVEGHGGRISVESAPGCGATFSFTLPLCPAESEDSVGEGQLEFRSASEGG